MFRPSPVLWRRLPAGRTPLDARESRKLLQALTKAFRQSLDSAHPGFEEDPHAIYSTEGSKDHVATTTIPALPETVTGRYLHAILTNPVLNYQPSQEEREDGRDPMDVFMEAVAFGHMTPKTAESCLRAKRTLIVGSAMKTSPNTTGLSQNARIRQQMRRSGAGRQVLQWLLSTETLHQASFWQDRSLSHHLLSFLAAEGLTEPLLALLEQEVSKTNRPDAVALKQSIVDSHLVSRMIEAEAYGNASLELTCKLFLHSQQLALVGDNQAAQTVARLICKPPLQHGSAIEAETFAATIAVFKATPRFPKLQLAYLEMLHPSSPSADSALHCLRALDCRPQQTWSKAKKQSILKLGFQTVRFVHGQGDVDTAKSILELLRRLVPAELGFQERTAPRRDDEIDYDTAEMLSLLNRLQPG